MKVTLKDVRGAFLNVFEPDQKYNRYGGSFPIMPGSANAKACAAAVEAVAKAKWGAKATGILAELKKKGDLGYQESPKANSEGEVYDGFEGMFTVNASNKVRPLALDRDKSQLSAADGRPYSGCYVNVSLEFWAQDNGFGKKINASLKGIQFVRDGDAFGGGAPASPDDFEDLGVGDEEESLAG